MSRKPEGELRRGWTTGACATAATRAAFEALLTGEFPDPVTITLPRGDQPSFALARKASGDGFATAGIVKDAGDDPDVTHGALVLATVRQGAPGSGVTFRAGEGVGTVTKAGLPIPPGEPAINPAPRAMMRAVIESVAAEHDAPGDVEITVAIPGGEKLAEKTWNPRLGILGGLSVLGTTGIVVPYSCSAWIQSIRSGVDVARANGLAHVAGATGKTSEATVRAHYGLPLEALIDMGDFAGGMLKYLRDHPVPRVTVAGGFAKMVKLAQGHMDLHSSRSQVDFGKLAAWLLELGGTEQMAQAAREANTAAQVLEQAGDLPLADLVARRAREVALAMLAGGIDLDLLVVDRAGRIIGKAGS
ncbi:MAG: cobalt-precorrin-5B (C(1))-methyltransferase [Alphaproteobacteria bacterium]|nr:cobalt-precorrin-5B (C(1))-methyltransferase [Alphaproteobacteria bacterium]